MFYRSQKARAVPALLLSISMLTGVGASARERAQQRPEALLPAASGVQQQGAQESTVTRPRRTDAPSGSQPATQTTTAQQPASSPAPRPTPAPARQDPNTTIDDDDEVLRVETDLTNVLFTAVDRNKRFVTTLKQADIQVFEDGVPQEIFTFQRETDRPLSLAILIDTSASQERTLPEEKSAAQRFVDTVIRPGKDEVAVLSFTGDTTLEQSLTGNASRVRRAIDRVEFVPPSGYVGGGVVVGTPPISGGNQTVQGSTAIWDAIWICVKALRSSASSRGKKARPPVRSESLRSAPSLTPS